MQLTAQMHASHCRRLCCALRRCMLQHGVAPRPTSPHLATSRHISPHLALQVANFWLKTLAEFGQFLTGAKDKNGAEHKMMLQRQEVSWCRCEDGREGGQEACWPSRTTLDRGMVQHRKEEDGLLVKRKGGRRTACEEERRKTNCL
eukprot:6199008-Pleurochrysis_carterae.AAC.1